MLNRVQHRLVLVRRPTLLRVRSLFLPRPSVRHRQLHLLALNPPLDRSRLLLHHSCLPIFSQVLPLPLPPPHRPRLHRGQELHRRAQFRLLSQRLRPRPLLRQPFQLRQSACLPVLNQPPWQPSFPAHRLHPRLTSRVLHQWPLLHLWPHETVF